MEDVALLSGILTINIVRAKNLKNADGMLSGSSDPYVTIHLDGKHIARTKTIPDNLNPVWKEEFQLELSESYKRLKFTVFDSDTLKSDFLGDVSFRVVEVLEKKDISGCFDLEENKEVGKNGAIHLRIRFNSFEDIHSSFEVKDTYFPLKTGGKVTLCHNAHFGGSENGVPPIQITPYVKSHTINVDTADLFEKTKKKKSGKKNKGKDKSEKGEKKKEKGEKKKGKKAKKDSLRQSRKEKDVEKFTDTPSKMKSEKPFVYKPANMWEEIYYAWEEAEKFIYITGWSVDTKISLLRRRPLKPELREMLADEDEGEYMTIGQQLKRKAEQGVRVLLLLWNEATSVGGVSSEGLMGTHDEETKSFFEGSGVEVQLALRKGGSLGDKFLWTHHQKTIICDADPLYEEGEEEDDERRLIAFIGGLDLCDGRWDTPQHTLFRSLQKEHKNDYHQVWPAEQAYGPREPWHDNHSMVEGPIARSILQNFEERWAKQASSKAGLLYDMDEGILEESEDVVYSIHNKEAWSSQLFRSIDSFSAIQGEHKDSSFVEKHIQEAYVHHIRRAKGFLFIENQYWLGSAQYWEGNESDSIACRNLIPFEIVNKICTCIENGKPFAAYIVIPMYPEGIPESGPVQEILHWQWKTISMMYARVHKCLETAGLLDTRKATDYLNFFCLGNRETVKGSQHDPDAPPPKGPKNESAEVLSKSRRFTIYVHSKMMIVDDEYCMLGSANINERSLAGDRDTEIVLGCYQPHYTVRTIEDLENGGEKLRLPRGAVHCYRMAMWVDHTRRSLDCFLDPSSVECVRTINEIAERNWSAYAGDELVELDSKDGQGFSHLLKYPFQVNKNGKVVDLKNHHFPDTKALIHGSESTMIPNILTT